jgi:hypothetical protein
MSQAYEVRRRDGRLPATWEVIHASAWGGEPHPAETPGFPREAVISPSAIRRK